MTDNVNIEIQRFKNHPSIVATSHLVTRKSNFCFNQVMHEKIQKLLRNLDTKKVSKNTDILTKLMKENFDIYTHFILKSYWISTNFKNPNVTPVSTKDSQNDETNYRPVSILPYLSKMYEKCIFDKMAEYFDDILTKYQCDFRKGYSSQHSLLLLR